MPLRVVLLFALALGIPAVAHADEPLTERFSFRRASDFFATGATLATDTDGNGEVDTLLPQASVEVRDGDLAQGATLQQALLYWGGTIDENANCGGGSPTLDDEVLVTVPGGAAVMVTADVCYGAGGDNQSRDVQSCRADISALVQPGGMVGVWTVGDFAARISDGDTDNASFALVLVYGAPELPPRQLTIYDGLRTMRYDSITFTLDQLEVDDPPAGDLTWYVMEGDIGGSDNETVTVRGVPGGRSVVLSDAVNPAQGPMNRTINTTFPPQEGVVGVDIDTFDIEGALVAGDDAVEVTYTADSDKWWIAFNIVGVRLFNSEFGDSAMTWSLTDDPDGDGAPTEGDEVTYALDLVNTGEGNAVVSVSALLPPQAASWSVRATGGGLDASTAGQLLVQGIPVVAGQAARVEFAVRLGAASAGTVIPMQASFDVQGGGGGILTAPDLVVGARGSGTLGDDDDGRDGPGWSQGCGCATAHASPAPSVLVLPLLLLGRRRRPRPPN